MYLTTLLPIFTLLLTSTSAKPTHHLAKRSDPIFTISKFSAYLSPDSLSSTVNFIFTDSRPESSLSIPCSASGIIYRDYWTACGGEEKPNSNATFRLSEGQLVVRRRWESGKWTITGEAPQGTYWNYEAGGNATKTEEGTTFTRTADWAFPVTSMSSFSSWEENVLDDTQNRIA